MKDDNVTNDIGRWYRISPRIIQHLLWPFVRIILSIFCRFKFYGRKNLKKIDRSCGVIFAANHASELDPPVVNAGFRILSEYLPLFFARDEITVFKDKKKFGWRAYIYRPLFFKLFGAYPVYVSQRNNDGGIDYEKALRNQIALLRNRESVLFFPEGMRTKDGALNKAHPGIGYLLYHTNTTVVPVAIRGTFNMSALSFLARKHAISVTFGEPIRREDILVFKDNTEPRIRDYKKCADIIMEKIAELLPPQRDT